jgi:hypothetical protein
MPVTVLGNKLFILTYLLTPWSRVLLEKLTVNFAASQEIPRIYGTRNFLTVQEKLFILRYFNDSASFVEIVMYGMIYKVING